MPLFPWRYFLLKHQWRGTQTVLRVDCEEEEEGEEEEGEEEEEEGGEEEEGEEEEGEEEEG